MCFSLSKRKRMPQMNSTFFILNIYAVRIADQMAPISTMFLFLQQNYTMDNVRTFKNVSFH